MKIKNLSDKTQEVLVKEHAGGEEYTVYIEAHGQTEIPGVGVVNPNPAISIGDEIPTPSETPTPVEVSPTPVVKEEKVEEEPKKEAKSEFICDECGAEFGSSRGLTLHKKKEHNQ